MNQKYSQVNYQILDEVKAKCIEAGLKTLGFADDYGASLSDSLGASSNIFSINLTSFLSKNQQSLYVTQLPEGLGTADDARPDDLTSEELIQFWYNIAHKTVSTLTNDAATAGVQTILLSLYLPSSTPETVFTSEFLTGFLDGIVDACKKVGCVYFSGETPQLKSKIIENRIDIAGSLFGIIPSGLQPITGANLAAGDKIVLLGSSGPHENGFTPLRALAEKLPQKYRTKLPSGIEYWQAINAPSVLYTPLIQKILVEGITPTNIENITGHGWQKLMRVKKPFKYVLNDIIQIPEVFDFVRTSLKSNHEEMIKIFNYGAGMAVFVKTEAEAKKVAALAESLEIKAVVAGHVEQSKKREVEVKPFGISIYGEEFNLGK